MSQEKLEMSYALQFFSTLKTPESHTRKQKEENLTNYTPNTTSAKERSSN